jgi:hypothetical protein
MEKGNLPNYEAPSIITYSKDDILEEIGPAQASEYNAEENI